MKVNATRKGLFGIFLLILWVPAAWAGGLSHSLRAVLATPAVSALSQGSPQALGTSQIEPLAQAFAGRGFPTRTVNGVLEVQVGVHLLTGQHQTFFRQALPLGFKVHTLMALPGEVVGYIPYTRIRQLAALPGVVYLDRPTALHAQGSAYFGPGKTQGQVTANVTPLLNAGITGQGQAIGIISNGDLDYQTLQQKGYLPSTIHHIDISLSCTNSGCTTNTTVYNNGPAVCGAANPTSSTPCYEAAWMAELAWDMAPKAQIWVCGGTGATIPTCAQALLNNGVAIIADDLGLASAVNDPFSDRSESGIASIVSGSGATWFSAAGNGHGASSLATNVGSNLTTVTLGGAQYTVVDWGAAHGQASKAYLTWTNRFTTNTGWTNTYSGTGFEGIAWDDDNPYDSTHPLTVIVTDTSGNVISKSTLTPGSNVPPYVSTSFDIPTDNAAHTYRVYVALPSTSSPPAYIAAYIYHPGSESASFGPVPPPFLNFEDNINLVNHGRSPYVIPSNASVYPGGAPTDQPFGLTYYGVRGPAPILWHYAASSNSFTRLATPLKPQIPVFTDTDGSQIYDPNPNDSSPSNFSFTGTSATSEVNAGILADILSFSSSITPSQALAAMKQQAFPGPSDNQGVWSADGWGYGQVNAAQAFYTFDAPPQPAITSPASSVTIKAGGSVTFAGSCTSPGGYGIGSYSWNFGNGQSSTKQNPGGVTFSTVGNYTVDFTCTDSQGLPAQSPATVSVSVQAKSSGSSSGGGGAAGLYTLLYLIGLVLALQRWGSVRGEYKPMHDRHPVS